MKTEKIKIKLWDLKDYLKSQNEVNDFNKNHQLKGGIFAMEVENIFKGDKSYLKSFK
jgi:hypothetical protein